MATETANEVSGTELADWRALVRRQARSARMTAVEIGADDPEMQARWLEEADALEELGDWLDTLVGVELRVKTNGHGKVRGSG